MSDDSRVPPAALSPALTPREWDDVLRLSRTSAYVGTDISALEDYVSWAVNACPLVGGDAHSLAALCLYGQPFGFTHEDVAYLRGLASDPFLPHDGKAASLADRIAALLPPPAPSHSEP